VVVTAAMANWISANSVLAQAYAWTGASGSDLNWSTPGNWAGGIAPVSSPTSRVEVLIPEFGPSQVPVQDFPAGFEVGELRVGGVYAMMGNRLVVRRGIRVQHLPTPAPFWSPGGPDISLPGNATLQSELPWNSRPGEVAWAAHFDNIDAGGDLAVSGSVRVFRLQHAGTLTVAAQSLLVLRGAPAELAPRGSIVVNGGLDLVGDFRFAPGARLDLSNGVLDQGRNDNTLGVPTTGSARIDGDVRLGQWFVGGVGSFGMSPYPPNDQLLITGELDLSTASLHPDSYGWADISPAVPLPPYLVLASYGSRLGSFSQTTLPVSIRDWTTGVSRFFDAPIVYTSAPGAGPGEIRLLLPEPTAASSLALAALLLLRGRTRR
jgi:hypothetical protein